VIVFDRRAVFRYEFPNIYLFAFIQENFFMTLLSRLPPRWSLPFFKTSIPTRASLAVSVCVVASVAVAFTTREWNFKTFTCTPPKGHKSADSMSPKELALEIRDSRRYYECLREVLKDMRKDFDSFDDAHGELPDTPSPQATPTATPSPALPK
jgi:hypothetical protein